MVKLRARMPETITRSVLVIDHNHILLDGISSLIRTEPDLVLAGAASSLQEGLALLAGAHIDCVLIDLDMPSVSGHDDIRSLSERDPALTIIGLITYELDDRASEALARGASAVLGKDQISQSLIELIRKSCRRF